MINDGSRTFQALHSRLQRFRVFYGVALLALLQLALLQIPTNVFGEVLVAPPNIILIVTDDQGYGDLSCHGNPILKTPNLDLLYEQGVSFSDFHVSPTCSPTRSALMTGRHEFRNGVTHTIFERERLTLQATTIAEVLKTAGYQTGIFGKWHLGDEAEYQPNRRGFDEVFIHGGGGIGQSYPGSCGDAPGNTYFDPVILHNGVFEKTRGYCTDLFFGEAEKWISARQTESPFFAYIATNAPHSPLQVRAEDEARYTEKVARLERAGQKDDSKGNVAKFLGMIANIDDNVGRLLSRLQSLGIDRNTLVIFMNDNGGTEGVRVFNSGMRGAKGTPWMGGTRAALFCRWPDGLVPGKVDQLTAHIDIFPTLVDISGAKPTNQVLTQVEGRSLLPLLKNSNAPWPERTLVTHVGRWPKGDDPDRFKYTNCSVRTSRWHLVSVAKPDQKEWQLFDVQKDPSETSNVAAENLQVLSELDLTYDAWWQSVQPQLVNENAQGPKENPFKELYLKQFGRLDDSAK